MDQLEERLTIGQVARRAGVASSSIRYYESIGLLPEADRESGQRRYDEDVVRRLEMIAVAQRAGFSLREIKELMSVADEGEGIADAMQPLAERKLTQVNAMLEQGQLMKQWLELASDCDCSSPDECSLFDEETGVDGELHVVRVVSRDGKPTCRKKSTA